MEFTLSGSQLLVSKNDLDFFQTIKNESIPLDLKLGGKTSQNVLKNKSIDEKCPDITKLGPIKSDLINLGQKRIKIKRITIDLG